MLNDTKHLSVQSFQRNQSLLEALNNYLIHIKLTAKGLDSKFQPEIIAAAKESILSFLKQLNEVVSQNEKDGSSITRLVGLDTRFKSLVNQFNEAKGKKSRFTSVLFRQNPECVIEMLESRNTDSQNELIKSLTELGNLIEDHLSTDTKEVIGDF